MSAPDSHVVAMPGFAFVLRVVIMVLSLIILGLAANSISGSTGNYYDWYYTGTLIDTSTMGFVLFLAIYSLLGNGYLILTPMFAPVAYNMWAHLVFEVISWLFWLCGFAAAGATAAASALLYSGLTGTYYAKWATTAAAAGLGAIVWILHLIVGIVFCVKLHRHRNNPNNSNLSPYGVQEKHEMGNVAPQPPQQQVVQENYPVPTQTPAPYIATPPPPQWQTSPPPHPQQGGQY